jgi:cell division protein FtsB
MIITDLARQTRMLIDLLSSDKEKETSALNALETLHQNASRLESIVSNSLESAVKGLETQIHSNLKQIFDKDDQEILKKLLAHIQTCPIDVEKYRSAPGESGFNRILYLMFQDFKRNLDLYLIEEVRPRLKKIIALLEDRIILYFQALFDSYQIDLYQIGPYQVDMAGPSQFSQVEGMPKFISEPGKECEPMDIHKIKKILGLELPAMVFEADYSPGIRAGVLSGFGFQTLVQVVKSLFQKSPGVSFSFGLRSAGEKIKKENQRVMKAQFEQYHQQLRNHYFLPLIQAAARDFKEKINDRFARYQSFEQEIEHLFSLKQAQKEDRKKQLVVMDREIRRVSEEIALLSDISWKKTELEEPRSKGLAHTKN